MSTSQSLINAKTLAETRQARFASRNRVNKIALTLSLAALVFGVFWPCTWRSAWISNNRNGP